MKRIDTATAEVDKFGAGKNGFRNGNIGAGVLATRLDATIFDHIQEQIAQLIESAGIALDDADYNQLYAAVLAIIAANQVTMPVGSIVWVPATAAPTGMLKLNGALLARASYADLWTYAQASGNLVTDADWSGLSMFGAFSSGDGATTFRLPDVRGYFLRALDDGRGIDTGRTIGSYQADDFKSHVHQEIGINGGATGAGNVGISGTGYNGVNTAATGGTETRPKNVAWLACIKY